MQEKYVNSLISAIKNTLEGLSAPDELTYEQLQANLRSLVRTHMGVYTTLLGSISPAGKALWYLLDNDRRIPVDDIDTDGEWDDLASLHDAYLYVLITVLALLEVLRNSYTP